jgi:hypothetical protein
MALGDDLQRLFSWLQTPDLRYREFAGEREMPDPLTPGGTAEAVPERRAGLRQPEFAEPEPAPERDPPAATPLAEPAEEPVAPPSAGLLGGAYRTRAGEGAAPSPTPAEDQQQSAGRQDPGRSLDSVFGRLSGRRDRLPDPRDRPQGPDSGSGGGRSR